jgi:two-component system, NtrC family, sensor kinase
MKIGTRLSFALGVPLATLVLASGFAYQKGSRTLLREELAREGRAIAHAVRVAAESDSRQQRTQDLRELADRVTGYERVLGVRLFGRDGALTYQPPALADYRGQDEAAVRRAISSGLTGEVRSMMGKQSVVGFVFPLSDRQGRAIGAVEVLQLESFIEQDARSTAIFVLVLTLGMLVSVVLIIYLVTQVSVVRPARQLVERLRDVGEGDLSARVRAADSGEFGDLAREFNRMSGRLEEARATLAAQREREVGLEVRLQNAERLAGLGRLAAGLAHEIGTPLNVISGRTEAMRRKFSSNQTVEHNLGIISSQIDRIVRTVRGMLDFAKVREPNRLPTDISAVLYKVLELIDDLLQRARVGVQVSAAPDLPEISADADQIQQVFLNVALNAVDAMPDGGSLRVAISVRNAPQPKRGEAVTCVVTTFEDSGCGIAEENRQRIFDPFFTTKEPGRGTGLGLAVSYRIVEEHEGWFDVESQFGEGSRVSIYLPCVPGIVSLPAGESERV